MRRPQIRASDIGKNVEIGCLIGKADVNKTSKLSAMHRLQAVLGRVKICTHVARPKERAVQFISPLMVGADQLGRVAFVGFANHRAAMAAGVVKRADLIVAAPH